MNELLLSLIGHMRWADAIVAESLQRNATPDPRGGAAVRAHRLRRASLVRAHRRPAGGARRLAGGHDAAQAAALAAEHADLYQRLVDGASAEQLARRVAYRNSAGRDFRSRVSDIVTHVAMHGSYHRGQIARRLRSAGLEPPYTDFIQYTRRDQ